MKQRVDNKSSLTSTTNDVPVAPSNNGIIRGASKCRRLSYYYFGVVLVIIFIVVMMFSNDWAMVNTESTIKSSTSNDENPKIKESKSLKIKEKEIPNQNHSQSDEQIASGGTGTTEKDVLDILNQYLNRSENKCYPPETKSKRKLQKVVSSASVPCPCGRKTQSDFKLNMAKMYGTGSYDLETLKRCLSLSLPLKYDDPIECWPKMVIMPSFPTNGSGLARLLLQKALGLLVRMDHYNEGQPNLMYELSPMGKAIYNVSSPCTENGTDGVHEDNSQGDDTSVSIPLMGKPAIFKSHHTNLHELALSSDAGRGAHGGNIAGVIRLARNPGDQILRNYHRWGNKGCSNDKDKKEECFREKAKSQCSSVVSLAESNWLPFHQFWNDFGGGNVPQIIYHYENFSDGSKVEGATEKVLKFLRSDVSKEGSDTSAVETDTIGGRIGGDIGAVEYKHGTLMAEICGKDAARKLHLITKDVTEKLGYVFDEEAATWSLFSP